MTHDITIPPEAVEAAARAIFDAAPFRDEEAPLHEQSELYQALTRAYATAALRAGIAAWPGLWMHPYTKNLTLPMPQENTNAEG